MERPNTGRNVLNVSPLRSARKAKPSATSTDAGRTEAPRADDTENG
jgi:hypothetical protein